MKIMIEIMQARRKNMSDFGEDKGRETKGERPRQPPCYPPYNLTSSAPLLLLLKIQTKTFLCPFVELSKGRQRERRARGGKERGEQGEDKREDQAKRKRLGTTKHRERTRP